MIDWNRTTGKAGLHEYKTLTGEENTFDKTFVWEKTILSSLNRCQNFSPGSHLCDVPTRLGGFSIKSNWCDYDKCGVLTVNTVVVSVVTYVCTIELQGFLKNLTVA